MTEVHDVASAEGFLAVVLSVVETNARAAAFYARLGYQRQPERDWQPVPDVTLQVWRRSLG
jgi:ribosomal protein S18 acetylase RimI-like enzyme